MALKRVPLSAADVLLDEQTGAWRVTFDGGVDIGDVNLLNAAGTKVNPATEDGKLADIETNTDRLGLVGGPSRVTVGATATLATLLGTALSTSLKRLMLIPQYEGVYFAVGAATANSPWIPQTGLVLEMTKTQADTLQFYAAAATFMTIIQEG